MTATEAGLRFTFPPQLYRAPSDFNCTQLTQTVPQTWSGSLTLPAAPPRQACRLITPGSGNEHASDEMAVVVAAEIRVAVIMSR